MRAARLAILLPVLACTRSAPSAPPAEDPPELPAVNDPVVAAPVTEPPPHIAPAADGSVFAWSTEAAAAEGTLTQKPGAEPGSCELSFFSRRINREAWHAQRCLGTREDLRFVGPDGRAVLVIHPVLDASWQTASAAELSRAGEPLLSLRGQPLAGDELNVHREGAKIRWLQGVVGAEGSPPALDPSGATVRLTRLDGTMVTVDFGGHLTPYAPPPPAPAAALPAQNAATDAPSAVAAGSAAAAQPAATPSPKPPSALELQQKLAREAIDCQRFGHCRNTVTQGSLDQSSFGVKEDRSSTLVRPALRGSENRVESPRVH